MKIFASVLVALLVACASPASAEQSAVLTKQIVLDKDIVPTWEQLGTRKKTKKIRLLRVYAYWAATEARDKRAIKTLYSTKKEDKAAAKLIDDFYDGAKKCLRKQKETVRKTRTQVDIALLEIKECIEKKLTPPKFTILASQDLPNDYFLPVQTDFEKEDPEEEEDDPTERPFVPGDITEPTSETPFNPSDLEDPTKPDVITGPVTSDDIVSPGPDEWPFSPVSPDVPPLWALDWDRSGSIDHHEWQAYVSRLHSMAKDIAATGRDETAVELLKAIIDYHYSSLNMCIMHVLKASDARDVQSPQYEVVAQNIQDMCNVKFRYSIFAGAPPFEWIAKHEPTVTAAEIESWFTKQVKRSRRDVLRGTMSVTHEEKEISQRLISCTYDVLKSAGESPIDRVAFYQGVEKIEACARE